MPTARILVADDDPSVLESTSGVLRDAGFDVRGATGRESLFSEMDRAVPDLLLLNVIMRGTDGVQLLQVLDRLLLGLYIPSLALWSKAVDPLPPAAYHRANELAPSPLLLRIHSKPPFFVTRARSMGPPTLD